MLRIENVCFKYKGSKNQILNNINFSVNDGEIVCIVGKNGSGKSTIGRLIAGISKLKNGNIFIDDINISGGKNIDLIRDNVGIVFQNPENQIIFNNIYDELSFSLKGLSKDEIDDRIDDALKQVDMLKFKDCDLYSLSLGQKQRIMIAEVLAKRPKYIIFDEPTTMIDSEGKEKIYAIMKSLHNAGFTIICITNLADEILLADRTIILDNGSIACEINKKDLVDKCNILRKYGIYEPTLLRILSSLKNSGVDLNLEDYSLDTFVNAIKTLRSGI